MVRASGDSIGEGSKKVEPGYAHLVIDECEAKQAKSGNYYFACTLTILAHSVPGQEGKVMKFQNFGGGKWFSLAAAIGLTDAITGKPFTRARLDEMRKSKAAKQAVPDCDFEPSEAVGRHFMAEIIIPKDENKQPKEYAEVGFDVFSVVDPEAHTWPKDAAAMAQIGLNVDGTPLGSVAPASQQPAATATTARPASVSGLR